MSRYPELSVGAKPLTLDRKVSVAPMMDWTRRNCRYQDFGSTAPFFRQKGRIAYAQ